MQRTKTIALIALLSALLSAAKFVLSALPNIEIVTILIILYATNLRFRETFAVTVVFVCIETLIYGIHTWTLSYIIYWNMLAAVAYFAAKTRYKYILMPIVAVIMTVFFGVLTTFIDVIIAVGADDFFTKFAIMYARGASFYIIHIVSNAILVSLLYPILNPAFHSVLLRYYGGDRLNN